MPVFHAGHFRVFWHVLMDAAFRADQAPDDSEVIIISPWISDVTTSKSGWSDSAVSAAFDVDGDKLESLSDVLGGLVKAGYEVTVLTLSTTGKWLPKARNEHLDSERRFMEKIRRLGVSCMIRDNVHMKYVATPFALIDGSINISFNGLSGRNQEAANLYYRDSQSQDYAQRRESISTVLVGARDYFSASIPIRQWSPPSFEDSPGSSMPDLSGQEGESFPNVQEGHYPPMTPSDFSPIGTPPGAEGELSLKAQCTQLLIWTGIWALDLLVDDSTEGMDHASLYESIVDQQHEERTPSLSELRARLLSPDDQLAQLRIRTRLGLTEDDASWQHWRGLAESLIGGLEHVSSRIASGEPPTEEDFEALSRLSNIHRDLYSR